MASAIADKSSIDEFLNTIKVGRLSYLLKSDDVYFKLIQFVYDNEKELMYTLCRHRFYVEYKSKEILL